MTIEQEQFSRLLRTCTPTTLAEIAADYSHELAERLDGDDAITFTEWGEMQDDAAAITAALIIIVGTEAATKLLMAAGADPVHLIFDS